MGAQESYDVADLKARLLECLGEHAGVYPVHIERHFPRILAKIVDLWGSSALDDYLAGLMVSDRPNRQGFPADIAVEIFRLSTLHGSLGFTQPQVKGTGWSGLDDAELFKHGIAKNK